MADYVEMQTDIDINVNNKQATISASQYLPQTSGSSEFRTSDINICVNLFSLCLRDNRRVWPHQLLSTVVLAGCLPLIAGLAAGVVNIVCLADVIGRSEGREY